MRGVPAGVATAVLWMIKLAVLGALLYFAFWLALWREAPRLKQFCKAELQCL